MGSLGDRIKGYEKTFSHNALKRVPLMIRVDGRAFHTFTRGMEHPFDTTLSSAMVCAAIDTAKDMQGFKAGYVQSDEATFVLTDYDTTETQGWFDYDLFKVVSISASLMSVNFARHFPAKIPPVFDSRAFSLPADDVVNALLWRAKDWERNSVQMYARAFFSHKQLHGKGRADMHEMLHSIGKNWATDNGERERNGTFIVNGDGGIYPRSDILPSYATINDAVGSLFFPPNAGACLSDRPQHQDTVPNHDACGN
jgi:tRNA(His) 5'-end guanylyltransferase